MPTLSKRAGSGFGDFQESSNGAGAMKLATIVWWLYPPHIRAKFSERQVKMSFSRQEVA